MIQVNLGHGVSRYFEILDWLNSEDIEYTITGSDIDWPCILEMEEVDAVALKIKFGL
jgi:hypothetical protein